MPVIEVTEEGLHVPAADVWIDPWRPVPRAIITHAHADHARRGSEQYLASPESLPLLHTRLPGATLNALPWREPVRIGDATISLHPAGHVLGSAQVRVEVDGEVWVVSGDYKRCPDPSCQPFEPVPCDTFITEATFALPTYHWQPGPLVAREILDWVLDNRTRGRASLLLCYSLGKAQRILRELLALDGAIDALGPILVHGAIHALNPAWPAAGYPLPPTLPLTEAGPDLLAQLPLALAPPAVADSPWTRQLGPHDTAFASGWMAVRGIRRRRAVSRGFILSDHADWHGLLRTIRDTGASHILATHGRTDVLLRHLAEHGLQAERLPSSWGDAAEGDA